MIEPLTHLRKDRLLLLLTLAVALTLVALGWMTWAAFRSYRFVTGRLPAISRMEEVRGQILLFDETLTMSARMAAATGDPQWEARYRRFDPQLDRALNEAMLLAPAVASSQAAAQTDAANAKLVKMENRAFELVRQGQQAEAQKLLSSEGYESEKKVYAAGMTELSRLLKLADDSMRAKQQVEVVWSVVTAAISAPLLMLGWWFVLRTTRRWQTALIENNQQLSRQAVELGEFTQQLDEKVGERTKQLEESNLATQSMMQDAVRNRTKAEHAYGDLMREVAERKKLEEQFREQASLLDKARDAILVRDLNQRIIYWNKGAERLYGWSGQEMIGRSGAELLYKDTFAFQRAFEHVLQAGEWVGELHQIRKDQQDLLIESRWTLVRDDAGQPKSVLAINTDVTERKRVEMELRKLSRAVEQSPVCIVITDRAGNIEYVNPKFTQLSGYTREEAYGKNPRMLKSGETPAADYQRLWQTITRGEEWRGEFHNKKKNGELYWEFASISPIVDETGRITHFLAVKEDITERKRAEQERRAIESRYQTLFESAGDALMTLEGNGFSDCNTATLKMFGCAHKREFISVHPGELSPPRQPDGIDSKTAAQRRIDEAFEKGVSCFEWVHRRITGEDFPAEVLLTPFRMDDRRVLLATVRDLTETKKAEQERTSMIMQLQQVQKLESIGRLAGGIAHEINTPTQYIGDNIRFLQDAFQDITRLLKEHTRLLQAAKQGTLTPDLLTAIETAAEQADAEFLMGEIPKAIDQSLEGVKSVAQIVLAMKEFSQPGKEGKSAINLNHAIENTTTVARNEWKYVADLQLDLEPALPPVPCLPGEFNQVILNLVINASHAIAEKVGDGTQGKGVIKVSTRQDGDWVEVRIADSGTGIQERVRDKIFTPFFTTKPLGKGSGQGLALAHSVVVDKHRGTIEFESAEGAGATFIIRLPLKS